ncbi:hypothetical protein Q9966_015327 [Columba livia]|nr:hypothetical protein Q9966_015327 [Columba livia]
MLGAKDCQQRTLQAGGGLLGWNFCSIFISPDNTTIKHPEMDLKLWRDGITGKDEGPLLIILESRGAQNTRYSYTKRSFWGRIQQPLSTLASTLNSDLTVGRAMALYSACRHQREKNNYFISLNRRLHMMTPEQPPDSSNGSRDLQHNEKFQFRLKGEIVEDSYGLFHFLFHPSTSIRMSGEGKS